MTAYFKKRWQGQVPAHVLLWRDMLLAGTFINAAVGLFSLILATQGLPHIYAALLFFSPLPYNLFLLLAFFRTQNRTTAQSLIAPVWFGLVTLI